MTSATSSRRRALESSAAWKIPCVVASTANLTLSAEQTIDGITTSETRILCKDQTDASENGIYKTGSSTWQREPDWDGTVDVQEGTIIPVSRGTTNSDTYWRITNTSAITIGTTNVTIAQGLTDIGIAATTTTTDESTDTTCFPTFVTAATGDLAQKTDAFLTYNSSTGDLGASTFAPTGDTASGDLAALGYTSTEGVILTGQGSANDVTIKNDADAEAAKVLTGTTDWTVLGTVKPLGDTASGDLAALGYTSTEGVILTGQGSANDVTIKNDADGNVMTVPTGTTTANFAGDVGVSGYFVPNTSTTAALAAVGNAINTSAGKVAGAMVYNTDTDNPVYAVGSADADIWVDGAGTTAHSPS